MDPSTTSALKDMVFYAARDGMARILVSILLGKSDEVIKEYVEQEHVENSAGERLTPLIIAARNGHTVLVRLLIRKFKVNLEHAGSVRFDNCFIDGATALWVAAGAGHIKIVKLLVRAGANVNHTTDTNSTALRAACFDGRLDVVMYLCEHGADVNIPNKYNNTCLMIASYKGHEDVVSYLLKNNVDPNMRAHCGASALYFASESGRVKIVSDLVEHGAFLTPNNYGMTPVLAAAERTRAEVVEYFLYGDLLSREEKITALELLGASYANDKDRYCLLKSHMYLMRAMEMRFEDPDYPPLPKPPPVVLKAYDNWVESQSIEELNNIENSAEALHIESLAIRERIMGNNNPEILHAIIYRGAVMADHGQFNKCIELWLHAMTISQNLNMPISKDLLRFAQVFSQIVNVGLGLKIEYIKRVLESALCELQRNKENIQNVKLSDALAFNHYYDEVESNLLSTLYILKIFSNIMDRCNEDTLKDIYKTIFSINSLQVTTRNGQTLLHLAVSSATPVDTFHTNDVCSFPCSSTTFLLIECGADVNALDLFRNTPLHAIVCYCKPVSDFNNLYYIILNLTAAGAHCDVVNSKGKTPLEMASTGVAEIILSSQTSISLQCLAARVIKKHNIPFQGVVPLSLENFIELHGPGYSLLDKY